jgi:peptide/nickel transport system ATP-binding protein
VSLIERAASKAGVPLTADGGNAATEGAPPSPDPVSSEPSSAPASLATSPATAIPLISLHDIVKRFVTPVDLAARIANLFGANAKPQVVHALDGVSIDIAEGEVVGLVGESGCGKSTLGRVATGIYPPTSGTRRWRGVDLATLPAGERRAAELRIQMVFQDPFASLNPRMRVGDAITEAPLAHGIIQPAQREDYLDDLLARVGLDGSFKRRYPHQFSGGQRSRLGIARALAVKPDLLVCDEAVAALDVSIQAQVLNLFMDLRESLGLTYLFISHDLGVVEHLSDRVVIMYLGRVVESSPTETLFRRANHPYTQALLAGVPRLDQHHAAFEPVRGEIPSPLAPPSGCHFHPRCPHATERCRVEVPALRTIGSGHASACHLNDP